MSLPVRGMPSRRALAGLTTAALVSAGLTAYTLPSTPAAPGPQATPYPRQVDLSAPADDGQDAASRLGLATHEDIAARLNAAQDASDRVSVEVVGSSTEGRDLYLVTLTAPESATEAGSQARMRDLLTSDPARAAADREVATAYKLPVLITANVHGNEWEGTDAALRLIEEHATSTDPGVEELLRTTRVHLLVSANPDGRSGNTRRSRTGFDLNRDLITASQPESRAVRDAVIATQPAMVLDLHGYVNGTLVEPTTAPHGENYELDLLIEHSWRNALGIEAAILALDLQDEGVAPPQVPMRDWAEGWDGWPPIFIPQYSALHGAVAQTIEVPLRVNNSAYALAPEELQRRAGINTDIAHAAITATLGYAVTHHDALLADQIEGFRRGVAGEAQRPVSEGMFGVLGAEDVYLTEHPRAYVIPMGEGQRSTPAAHRLVEHLLANDVAVARLKTDAVLGGTSYPAGSFVVDTHQAKRPVVGAILGPGTDISDRVEAMYDISGWSHALLWGADVETVPTGSSLDAEVEPVSGVELAGSVEDSAHGWVLRLDDPADVTAWTALTGRGVEVGWLEDGSLHVPAPAGSAAQELARTLGVRLAAATAEQAADAVELPALRLGAAATAEERGALAELGLTVEPVSTRSLNEGLDLSELDALYVSSGLRWRDLDTDARTELEDFVAGGGGIVGRGPQAAALNDALDLLDVEAVAGRGDANGVVAVVNDDTSPVVSGAPEHSFVYSPVWFTELGEEVRIDQRLGQDPLVAGHWRAEGSGRGGQEAAAGQALVVSGTGESGSRIVLMGSEPLFRAHPKGLFTQVARALIWTGLGP